MFIVINVILVAAAFMLVLVIAATASLPSRQVSGLETPEGDWMGPANLSAPRTPYAPIPSRGGVRRPVAATGSQ